MAEYIEREALLDDLRGSYNDLMRICDKLQYPDEKEICKGQLATFLECILRVKDAPAADVVEVVHGRWEIILDDFDCEFMRCSCCGEEFYNGDEDTIDRLHNYCPNCGAKMDGGKHEQSK